MSRRARLGQHFLHDPEIIERSIAAISPRPGEAFVEIGPGRGALTVPLLARAGSLDAIEIDRDLARRLGPRPGLRVHVGDALGWPLANLARNGNRLRIAGNLPYYLSTPLLFRLFDQAGCIEDMHFMLQREVMERMTAEPGTSAYGRLGLMVRCHAQAQALFEVPPDAFRPPPRVWSAFVRLRLHRRRPVSDVDGFRRLVTQAFNQRRKRLGNALRGVLDEETIRARGVDPDRRPGTLSFQEFASLARAAASEGRPDNGRRARSGAAPPRGEPPAADRTPRSGGSRTG